LNEAMQLAELITKPCVLYILVFVLPALTLLLLKKKEKNTIFEEAFSGTTHFSDSQIETSASQFLD